MVVCFSFKDVYLGWSDCTHDPPANSPTCSLYICLLYILKASVLLIQADMKTLVLKITMQCVYISLSMNHNSGICMAKRNDISNTSISEVVVACFLHNVCEKEMMNNK